MVVRARELGLSVMVGCMTESTFGISAIAPPLSRSDWFDGAMLPACEIASGVWLYRGSSFFPAEIGTGGQLLEGPSPHSAGTRA
jgi:L-Ala-D/L-Glu epimerase / N-acetyl-D-glutamate racemase